MSVNSASPLSLIERKKLQWAKEKEELAELKAPWGVAEEDFKNFDRHARQMKRSSLPPLYKNQYNSYDKEKEIGGETSGYGSDNAIQSPDYAQTWHQSGYESSSSRDDRLKWSNRSIGTNKVWPPKEESVEKVGTNEPPNWVKRGLKNGEIMVNNTSPAESPEHVFDEERPQTSSSYSNNRASFLRGQNIPIDPLELAERERRRQAALAHQDAILRQLDEREKKRQEEKERRIKEEYEEEMRIQREQEAENKRKERELRLVQERLEKEQKRKEAIEEAIEIAQKEAQLAKAKKNKHNNYINSLNNLQTRSKVLNKSDINVVELNNNENSDKISNNDAKTENFNNDVNNNSETNAIKPVSPRIIKNNDTASNNDSSSPNSPVTNNLPTPTFPNNLAFIVPTPYDNLQHIQYAILIPQNIPVNFSINKSYTNSSTQTEDYTNSCCENQEKSITEKFSNIDLSYEPRNRKERRSRSQSLEERPKWGANKPPARYVKQSEKDLLYQRRKLRQKLTVIKTYDDKNSSDESLNGTPRLYRKKGGNNKRHSRSNWRCEELSARTDIIPLECSRNHIYYKACHYCCICRCCRHKDSAERIKEDNNILKINNSPRDSLIYDSSINASETLPNLENNDMYVKLSKLQNNLLNKQNEWENILVTTP